MELFSKSAYPSASECAVCHPKHWDEWRTSSHSYSFTSPMFHKFEQTISELSQGTVGYFCQRCHSPIGTAMNIDRSTKYYELPRVAREGVTCIVCHRINEQYGRNNGERRVIPGPITDPVYGSFGGDGVEKALANKSQYKVKANSDEPGPGQVIHNEGRFFRQLQYAEFCTSCHQVAVQPNIKLEIVWDQYRRSPACRQGITCQDCHMGKDPGEPHGYEYTSIAEVGGLSVNENRKHANHSFYGPNASIAHPGVYPFNNDAQRWQPDEWTQYDWRAGWGTDEFEEKVEEGLVQVNFPEVWSDPDDRYDARAIIEDNQALLGNKNANRRKVMGHSLKVQGPFFKFQPESGEDLDLHYDITNLNAGHNVLTASLGAQPQYWANVVLVGPDGQRLWETGYVDSDGDVADYHSVDVHEGRVPFDRQLFNLQAFFLITGVIGTDRELPVPVNVSFDQLPFLRPGNIPTTVTNHPPFIRMESRSLAPLASKRVKYRIPGELVKQPGRYRLSFRMRNRIEPIYFMRFCNTTEDMVRAMLESTLDTNVQSVEFWVK